MALNEVPAMRGHNMRLLLGCNVRLLLVWTALAAIGQPVAHGYRESTPAAAVNFQLYWNYLIVVQGSAGPIQGLNFLVDTGATPSVLDPQLAGKLHLDTQPIDVAVLGGKVQGGIANVPSLQIGPIRKDNLRVMIEDLSFIQKSLPFRIDGIVGLDVLGQSPFVIDYASRKLRFGPPPAMQLSLPLQMKQGRPIITAAVDGTPADLLLDTGAPSLVLFQQMQDSRSTAKGQPAPASIGEVDRKQVEIVRLVLGQAEFSHESALMARNYWDAGHDFDGLISPTALGITRLAIDLAQAKVAFNLAP
jgi:predicted aspartyl protease